MCVCICVRVGVCSWLCCLCVCAGRVIVQNECRTNPTNRHNGTIERDEGGGDNDDKDDGDGDDNKKDNADDGRRKHAVQSAATVVKTAAHRLAVADRQHNGRGATVHNLHVDTRAYKVRTVRRGPAASSRGKNLGSSLPVLTLRVVFVVLVLVVVVVVVGGRGGGGGGGGGGGVVSS